MANGTFLAVVVYEGVRWLAMMALDQVVEDKLSFAKEYLKSGSLRACTAQRRVGGRLWRNSCLWCGCAQPGRTCSDAKEVRTLDRSSTTPPLFIAGKN